MELQRWDKSASGNPLIDLCRLFVEEVLRVALTNVGRLCGTCLHGLGGGGGCHQDQVSAPVATSECTGLGFQEEIVYVACPQGSSWGMGIP